MEDSWTTVTLKQSTKDDLSQLKAKNDTWDDLLTRLAATTDSDIGDTETELRSIAVQEELQVIQDTLEELTAVSSESRPDSFDQGTVDDIENSAYRGAKRALEELQR